MEYGRKERDGEKKKKEYAEETETRKIYCCIKRDAGVKTGEVGIFSEAFFKKAPRVTKQILSISEGDTR